jgi:RNA polymerase sigma factor (sigma-70 family)
VERLFAVTSPLVARLVALDPARIPHADESIDDLSQNICMRVFRKLKSFRGVSPLVCEQLDAPPASRGADDSSVWQLYRSWLRETARRIVLNDRKKYQRRERLAPHTRLQSDADNSTAPRRHDPPAPGAAASSEARSNERVRRVLEAIGKIADPLDREIIRLRYLEHQSLRDIAGRFGLTYDMARARHRRSKASLQSELKDLL